MMNINNKFSFHFKFNVPQLFTFDQDQMMIFLLALLCRPSLFRILNLEINCPSYKDYYKEMASMIILFFFIKQKKLFYKKNLIIIIHLIVCKLQKLNSACLKFKMKIQTRETSPSSEKSCLK